MCIDRMLFRGLPLQSTLLQRPPPLVLLRIYVEEEAVGPSDNVGKASSRAG